MAEKMYDYTDLVAATADYAKAKDEFDAAMRMVQAKRIEMQSFERTADQASQLVARFERKIQEVIRDLKKL